MLLDCEQYLGLISQFKGLFEESFAKPVSLKELQWRYLDNPMGDLLMAVQPDNGLLVANYSASPVLLSIKGWLHKTGLSMTTMTHPNFRRKGLFPQLAQELYAYMESQHYSIVWGFPNKRSHQTFVRHLGWKDIHAIPLMRLALKGQQSEPGLASFDNEFLQDYPEQVTHNLIHVPKDRSYLRWRYGHNPRHSYYNMVLSTANRVSSFCIIKFYLNTVDLVDFQAQNPEEGEYLLRQVVSLGRKNKCALVNCWAPKHHFMHSLCKKMGFEASLPFSTLCFKPLAIEDGKYVERYDNWYVQMGDADVY